VAAVETALGAARAAGRPSLVGYLTGGIRADWTDLLAAIIDAGADAVEIGLPFSDPMLDGPVIQRASETALARGATPARILAELRAAGPWAVPLIAMSYANHAFRPGLPGYCAGLAAAGFSGTIIPDLPAAEADGYLAAAEPDGYLAAAAQAGLDATLMVTPATPAAQRRVIAARTRGFLYVMSVMATTGTTDEKQDASRWAVAARARAAGAADGAARPVLIGFGISTPARAAAAVRHADGVIVASALMRRVLDGATAAELGQAVGELRAAVDGARP
jgi:tryptophan synthase alpha chain